MWPPMLSPMKRSVIAPATHRRDERGTSLVEFALVVTLLSTLLLGIIVFGILLSKRQVLTQAAAEGARAAVPIQYTTADQSTLIGIAQTQVNKSLEAVNRACGDGSTTCGFVVYSCGFATSTPPSATAGNCLQVTVDVNVGGSNPLVPSVGFISPFLPSKMSSTFTSRLADPT